MKAPDAFRTISEVAEDLDLPQHVLRFWETRFTQIKPMKRGGGRRYYRPEDVDLLRGIRLLLYSEGFTIRGVQRLLKEKGARLRRRRSGKAVRRKSREARGFELPHPTQCRLKRSSRRIFRRKFDSRRRRVRKRRVQLRSFSSGCSPRRRLGGLSMGDRRKLELGAFGTR